MRLIDAIPISNDRAPHDGYDRNTNVDSPVTQPGINAMGARRQRRRKAVTGGLVGGIVGMVAGPLGMVAGAALGATLGYRPESI
jgi:hypothetical protein